MTTSRPILFTGPMVRALLAGTKTQTRRIVKGTWHEAGGYLQSEPGGDEGEWCFGCSQLPASFLTRCPHGLPGDTLWVRETFYNDIPDGKDIEHVYYRADGTCCEQIPECSCAEVGKVKWTPSIFMPRWASRITLQVTGVRVERLREISAGDCLAEGIDPTATRCVIAEYRTLWDSINAARGYGWASNPFVWCLSFTRLAP